MIVVGLTGSIGMGKTTTAGMFRDAGLPVYDADAAVHGLYDRGGAAVEAVEALFPGVVRDGSVDREALRKQVLDRPDQLKRLTDVVHPLVAKDREAFFARAVADGAQMVVLDIPLLFEGEGHRQVDAIVVVSAPEHIQRERVLARPGMTPERLDAILAKQLPDAEKRARADFVVETDKGLDHARAQVAAIIHSLRDPSRLL